MRLWLFWYDFAYRWDIIQRLCRRWLAFGAAWECLFRMSHVCDMLLRSWAVHVISMFGLLRAHQFTLCVSRWFSFRFHTLVFRIALRPYCQTLVVGVNRIVFFSFTSLTLLFVVRLGLCLSLSRYCVNHLLVRSSTLVFSVGRYLM